MDKTKLVTTNVSVDGITVEYLWPEKIVNEQWVYHYNHFQIYSS